MITKQQREIKEFAKKIAPVYKLLKWKWFDGVPSAKRIESVLLELLEHIKNEKGVSETSTGGLFARKEKDEEGRVTITYGFVNNMYYEV